MPFGLSGAPASFQRIMDQTLRGLNDFVGVYLDDIVIYRTSSSLTASIGKITRCWINFETEEV